MGRRRLGKEETGQPEAWRMRNGEEDAKSMMMNSASTNMVKMSEDNDETGRDVNNTDEVDGDDSCHHATSLDMH